MKQDCTKQKEPSISPDFWGQIAKLASARAIAEFESRLLLRTTVDEIIND